jgi:ketosteroid isomerase-like protein
VADLDKSIVQVLDAYSAAVFSKDIDAFIRLYDPSARVYDAWGVWSYEGASAWRIAAEGWFTSLNTERVKVTFEDVKATVAKDFAYVSAIVTYAGISSEGTALRAMQNRLTWVLRMSGHVLRVVHEHTSAPIGFEDMKAILQRGGPAASPSAPK